MKLTEFVMREPVTMVAGATLADAAETMAHRGVGSVIVVEEGRPIGIVTDRDLVVRGIAKGLPPDARLDSVMTMGVTTLDADCELDDLIDVFSHRAIRRVPVVATRGHEVVGLVSLDDLLVSFISELGGLGKVLAAQIMFPHACDEPPVPAKL